MSATMSAMMSATMSATTMTELRSEIRPNGITNLRTDWPVTTLGARDTCVSKQIFSRLESGIIGMFLKHCNTLLLYITAQDAIHQDDICTSSKCTQACGVASGLAVRVSVFNSPFFLPRNHWFIVSWRFSSFILNAASVYSYSGSLTDFPSRSRNLTNVWQTFWSGWLPCCPDYQGGTLDQKWTTLRNWWQCRQLCNGS